MFCYCFITLYGIKVEAKVQTCIININSFLLYFKMEYMSLNIVLFKEVLKGTKGIPVYVHSLI